MPAAPRPFVPASPTEYLLHALTGAMELHGLGSSVGLFPAASFPQHAGGIGIVVCFPAGKRAAARCEKAAWLLTAMGCSWVKDRGASVEAHLAGKLLSAPPVLIQVSSADSCGAADAGQVADMAGMKRCAGPHGAVLPVSEFIFLNRATGRRCSYCGPCEKNRQLRARQKRAREARQGVPVS